MITTKYNTTTVTFGKDGIGTIGLIGKRGAMTMQQLINECEIGKPFDMAKDVSELPKVILEFNEISSVESLIKVLERVKEKMQEPEYPTYCYAC
jgi:hypothetical protein